MKVNTLFQVLLPEEYPVVYLQVDGEVHRLAALPLNFLQLESSPGQLAGLGEVDYLKSREAL